MGWRLKFASFKQDKIGRAYIFKYLEVYISITVWGNLWNSFYSTLVISAKVKRENFQDSWTMQNYETMNYGF
jgi:hypothetical protein